MKGNLIERKTKKKRVNSHARETRDFVFLSNESCSRPLDITENDAWNDHRMKKMCTSHGFGMVDMEIFVRENFNVPSKHALDLLGSVVFLSRTSFPIILGRWATLAALASGGWISAVELMGPDVDGQWPGPHMRKWHDECGFESQRPTNSQNHQMDGDSTFY